MIPTIQASVLLDRLAARRSERELVAALAAGSGARFLILAAGRPAILGNPERTAAQIRWLDGDGVAALGLTPAAALFLGIDPGSGHGHFVLALPEAEALRLEAELKPAVDLRSLATEGIMNAQEVSLLGLAKSLADWHAKHGFCSACGTATDIADGGWRRVCPSCGYQAFPRVDPVVIMAITDGERLVLARQSHFPEGMYSLPAGFVEPGEDMEHAVRRETLEEVGLRVGAVRYALSQPWPFPHSLMLGCRAEVAPGEIRPDVTELEDARWFSRCEVSAMLDGTHEAGLWVPGRQAIAHTLICDWLEDPNSPAR